MNIQTWVCYTANMILRQVFNGRQYTPGAGKDYWKGYHDALSKVHLMMKYPNLFNEEIQSAKQELDLVLPE